MRKRAPHIRDLRPAIAFLAISISIFLAACSIANADDIQHERGGVVFDELRPGVWLHTSYQVVDGYGRIPTNGMVIEHGESSILIDTGWTNEQTDAIAEWAAKDLGKPLNIAVFTHAHSDKMGGVETLQAQGVDTYAHPLTNELAPQRGLVAAEHNLQFDSQGYSMELPHLRLFYPGGGHSEDNIVAGVTGTDIVFGGCLIRPSLSRNLGNTGDANLAHWSKAASNVALAFPDAELVIPSHGPPAGREIIKLTETLAGGG